jgi:small subunit ribosomal protein S4
MVNGHLVNIPSYRMRPGDVVSVREKSKSLAVITSSLSAAPKRLEWLDWNVQHMAGTFLSVPMRDQIPENIKESLIVELYSK